MLRDQSSDGLLTAYAMFSDPNCAVQAKTKYDNEIVDAHRIQCNEVGVLKSTSFKDVSGCLRLYHGLGNSTGTGHILFDDQNRAELAVRVLEQVIPTSKFNIVQKKKPDDNKLVI